MDNLAYGRIGCGHCCLADIHLLVLQKGVVLMAKKKPEKQQNTGTYECFHCGHRSVIWGNDFDAEDYGYDRKGVVHSLSCMNCGADIEYVIFEDEKGETEQ